MSAPNLKELNESIEMLSRYQDRLQKEIISISKKLQLAPQKINSNLESHPELIEIKKAMNQLMAQRDKQKNQSI